MELYIGHRSTNIGYINIVNMIVEPTRNTTSNMAIAAAITSEARVMMSKYILDELTIYSDTDSIITSRVLDDSLVNDKIGYWKLEYIIDDILIIDKKFYGFTYDKTTKSKVVIRAYSGDPLNMNELMKLYETNKPIKWLNIY